MRNGFRKSKYQSFGAMARVCMQLYARRPVKKNTKGNSNNNDNN